MHNYYFLAASLPPLTIGEAPEITFEELEHRLKLNLSKSDLEKTVVLKRYIDLQNIRALLEGEPIDPRGNLTEKELDEAMLIQDILPEYVFDFLDHFENKEDKLRNFSGLYARYFSEEIPKQKGFLAEYLEFEREWRLVLIGLRAKRLKRDLISELQFEDFSDSLIAHLLSQKDMDEYEPPEPYLELKQLLKACANDPWQQYLLFSQYRFRKIEEMASFPLFSIDWILGYIARLMIVDKYNELNAELGKTILENFKTG